MAAFSSIHTKFIGSSPLVLSSKLTKTSRASLPIRAGPRSNRGPLVRGRILSTEAIIAIQSLKRAHRNNTDPTRTSSTTLPNLSRLIKSDLVSILRELLRQNQCALALHVLSTLRSEYPEQSDYDRTDLFDLYADVVFSLAKNNMSEEIDALVDDAEGLLTAEMMKRQPTMDKKMVRLMRGVVEGRRREATVKICEMMRRSGCGDTWTADEYVVKMLSRGLNQMEETELAKEVEREFDGSHKGNLDKSSLSSLV